MYHRAKKLYENWVADAWDMFREKHLDDLPCSSGNYPVYRLHEERI